jgi:hypothetical protein
MLWNPKINSSLRYSRFGQLAVKRGFVTIKQLDEALTEQIANDPCHRLRCRRRVGEIFFERGWMNSRQVQMVLDELSEH